MRILTSVGLIALAAIGTNARAQKLERSVRPVERITVAPIVFEWSDLVQIQASLPRMSGTMHREPERTFEPPLQEIAVPDLPVSQEHALPEAFGGDVEKLGPCSGFPSEPPIGLAFDSQLDVPDGAGFSFIPPDVAGGVGTRHLMTMLNNQVLITDRLGGFAVAPVDTSVFWSPLGATPLGPTNTYHRVYFDTLADRWLASARNGVGSTGSTVIFFAISQTDDPTGTWDYYSFVADPGSTTQADWVALGYNSTWITITANMLNLAGTVNTGAKMWTIDKASALVPGGPITVTVFPVGFMATAHGSGGSTIMPARTLDSDPTLWMVNSASVYGTVPTRNWLLQLTRITGTGPSPVVSGLPGSPFGGTTSFCTAGTTYSFTQRTMAQSAPETRFITPFNVRVASVAVRNGQIWIVNSGGLPGLVDNASPTSNGIVWHHIDPMGTFPPAVIPPSTAGSMVIESGAITNGVNTMSMYPSIAVNCANDVLIGYANGDSTRLPRACYSMRLGTDPAGFMGAMKELKAGESNYWKNFGIGTTAQYGRYTSTSVDPNDDRTLWTLQEYADTRVGPADNDSRWGTRWGRFGDCDELPEITDQPDSPPPPCVGDPVSFTVVAAPSNPAITYQWRHDGIDILGATSDTYSIATTVLSDAGDYDVVLCGCGQTISAVANLSFAGPTPTITTQPVSVTAALGDPASFFVVATGTGTLTYQWYRNGNPIALATSDTYSIASVASDYGSYVCVVTDDCGPVTSDVALLKPPTKHKAPTD